MDPHTPEAHTPKGSAIAKFIEKEQAHAQGWKIQIVDEHDTPMILLQASSPDGASETRRLEVHSRQVTLTNDQLDASTQKMITRWLESLSSGAAHKTDRAGKG